MTVEERWRRQGYWRDIGLGEAFRQTATRSPGATLRIHSADRPTLTALGQLHARGLRLAGSLYAMGLRRGDVIALQLPHWEEAALVYQAAAALGCVILPVVPIFAEAELGFILRDSKARSLFVPNHWRKVDYLERVRRIGGAPDLDLIVVVGDRPPPGEFMAWDDLVARRGDVPPYAVQPDDPAFMVYTSGTTADPKGVIHSSNTLLAEVFQSYPPGGATARVLSPYPAGHVAGALGVLAHAVAGCPTVLFDVWNPAAAVEAIEREAITHTAGTPFHYLSLFDAAEAANRNLSSLRACGTGGATVPESLVARAERLGVHLFRRYGMTEHPTVTQGADEDPLVLRMTTDGHPRDGIELRIVDDAGNDLPPGEAGEVATRGPDMFMRYTDPALTEDAHLPGRWYLSGDIGRIDDQGCLTIVDRKKDIIIRGGENISSREIEDLVLRLPGVTEVAAVGMPDERLGERVCVYVLGAPGLELTVADLEVAFAGFGVARQKVPERVIMIADPPRTPAGKIKKAELRRALRLEAMGNLS